MNPNYIPEAIEALDLMREIKNDRDFRLDNYPRALGYQYLDRTPFYPSPSSALVILTIRKVEEQSRLPSFRSHKLSPRLHELSRELSRIRKEHERKHGITEHPDE